MRTARRFDKLNANYPFVLSRSRDPFLLSLSKDPFLLSLSKDPFVLSRSRDPFLLSLSKDPFVLSLSKDPFLLSLSKDPFLLSLSKDPFVLSLSKDPFLLSQICCARQNETQKRPPASEAVFLRAVEMNSKMLEAEFTQYHPVPALSIFCFCALCVLLYALCVSSSLLTFQRTKNGPTPRTSSL
jgi:hypothetical protein